MKRFKSFVFLVSSLFSASSYGEVSFSYSYKFGPSYLQKLYDGLFRMQTREPDEQDLLAFATLSDGSLILPITAMCFPQKPDASGKGCTVSAVQDPSPTNGQLNVTIRKPVEMPLLLSKLSEITTAIGSSDPNTAQGHLNFGNVLYNAADDTKGSSDYFCAPEGPSGAKTWQCYLSVREKI